MSRKGSSSSSTQSTSNVFTDNSANAAEGGMAVGAGASVNIESLDKDVALGAFAANQNVSLGALAANQNVAGMALDTTARTAQLSIGAQNELAGKALDTNARLVEHTTNTIFGLADIASRERQDVLDTTHYALQSQKGVTDQLSNLASAALERSQTPDSQVTKTLLWVVGAVAVVFGLFALRRRS